MGCSSQIQYETTSHQREKAIRTFPIPQRGHLIYLTKGNNMRTVRCNLCNSCLKTRYIVGFGLVWFCDFCYKFYNSSLVDITNQVRIKMESLTR
jgi:protein-arginine kinase activator protein McsA